MTPADDSLPPLIAGLLDPQLYDHPVRSLDVVQTHISWIILTGDFAYKIKKPVDLGFLDFSSLEKRQLACHDELRLNQRLAPDTYLDVVGIGGSPAEPCWNSAQPIEFAVKMRQFPQSAQLDRVLEQDALQAEHIDAFAELIADFHSRIESAATGSDYGTAAAVYAAVAENFVALRECIHKPANRARLDALENWSQDSFADLRDCFDRRKASGCVRECHGDLHLRNLAWVDDRPLAFDCIEFNAELRWIDVISDIAFLVMDLEARSRPDLAARFLNRYLEHTGDYAGLAPLPFYLAYRAIVRAKVDAIRVTQPGIAAGEKHAAEQECVQYLELARQYTELAQPRVVLMRGLSASGKSSVSLDLAVNLGAIRIRSDVERKRLHGLDARQSAAALPGEGIYDAAATAKTYAHLLELAKLVLDAGFTVVIDAASLDADQRTPFRQLARTRALPYCIVETHAPPETLRRRITGRGKGVSDAGLAVLEKQLATWRALDPAEEPHAIRVDTDSPVDYPQLLRRIGSFDRV
ncbi:MAG: AAA family ATPase [Gammaproteobacteria bacterium]|nr:AAA family ATPase [Gammaproteobacteria bacterium]